jgi:hypothetical protein
VRAVFTEAPRHRVAGRPVARPGVVKASGAASVVTSTPCADAAPTAVKLPHSSFQAENQYADLPA